MSRIALCGLGVFWLVACAAVDAAPPTTQAWLRNAGSRWIASTQAANAAVRGFTRTNWTTGLKQKGNIQVYIYQTPDFFEVIEQERPRALKTFNDLDGALDYANRTYPDWPIVPYAP